MKQEARENGINLSKGRLFWRIQKECWRRMVTPFLMYLFMSLLMLACQAISADWAKITFGIVCMLGGMAFNAHLCYNYGIIHFDAYLTGCLHRRNAAYGIVSGGDHRVEREYRPWKGFYIGFLVGIPVIIFGSLAGAYYGQAAGEIAGVLLIMFAAWAIIPVSWIRMAYPTVSFYWSVLMAVIPVIVSGIFYIVGAVVEKKRKEQQTEREAAVAEAARSAREPEHREQTEEQRRKTLQSKKKK